MDRSTALLAQIRAGIDAHARPDMTTAVDGLLISKVAAASEAPDYALAEPLVVVMAQGGKRLRLGEQTYEYRAGDCLVVTANLPVTGHYIDITAESPAMAMALVLRPVVVAELALKAPAPRPSRPGQPAMSTGTASPELLDAAARLLELLDHPVDIPVLAPMIEREIIWRLLTGPQGATIRQIGLPDSDLSQVSRAIGWLRDNFAEPMRVEDLARLSGMSTSAFHRHFRAVTAMSPLQFQKRIRLQEARAMLIANPGDVAGIGHRVGYDSPSQFNREYRRLFGVPPGQDAARLRMKGQPGRSALVV